MVARSAAAGGAVRGEEPLGAEGVECERDSARVGPACAAARGEPVGARLTEVDDPVEPDDSVESAAATAGIAASAAPTPSATAEAPIQAASVERAAVLGAAMPPNSGESMRRVVAMGSVWFMSAALAFVKNHASSYLLISFTLELPQVAGAGGRPDEAERDQGAACVTPRPAGSRPRRGHVRRTETAGARR